MVNNFTIGIIGLGYVGLNLAASLSKKFKTIGFDINKNRINQLKKNVDITGELNEKNLNNLKLKYTYNINDIKNCKIFIITVPTPIYKNNNPDLRLLKKATVTVAKIMSKKSIVIYESTVYPGLTEEFCIPILSKISGMKLKKDYNVGYSPERINPSDKKHRFENINKIVSSTDKKSLELIHSIYQKVINKKVYKVSSIKIAEAAKIIENAQRDINIAFINELSIIFDKMKLDTYEILNAASTKWNFLNFSPGLVGGHCIGVDPYYLTYAAKNLNYNPEIILSGRKINDNYSTFVAKKIINNIKTIKKPRICILGATFKENCKDLRNSKVQAVFKKLKNSQLNIKICDPIADQDELKNIYKKNLIKIKDLKKYNMIVLLVPHSSILKFLNKNLNKILLKNGCIFDLKNKLKKSYILSQKFNYVSI